ncbi:MAG: polysaccharide deacetylase family protein [Campylobacterota bacterium]|nr:polysaccharide deacetylase family protein [Campylobacterota bacterium]
MMYHHVNSDRCSNDLDIFEKHLKYISENYTTLFPGEEVKKNSICLTFDDAYADFYYLIFPLLQKYNLKALLGVPTKYILEKTDLDMDTRLGFEHNDLFKNYQQATFCTFDELKQMEQSGLVQIVSHSHTHTNLLEDGIDLDEELVLSKKILEDKLHIKVESFIFPFGKYDEKIAQETLKHYKYAFRIGNAVHKDFSGIKGINYRVDGDGLTTPNEIFTFKKMLGFRFKALVKSF